MSQQQFDRLVQNLESGKVSRRDFFAKSARLGVGLATVVQVLDATPPFVSRAEAASPPFPPGWNPYPFSWGENPIASGPDDAIKWWLARIKDSSVRDDNPQIVLTEEEIAQLKAMKPSVGHSWYSLSVPAIAGWNEFWKAGVSKWAANIQVYDNEAKPERMLLGTEFLINQGLHVTGSLTFDWILFGESMKRLHAAKVATTACATSPSAYYPPTCTCMGDDVTEFKKMVMPIAKFFRAKGFKEIDAVWLVEAHPSWFSISRQTGFQHGLDDPAVHEICKINIIDTKPVLENDDTQQAAEAALQQHPNVKLFIMLAHQYVGAAAAVRSAGRRDVWVAASDLDEGTATSLLHGGWPVMITYSLPIAGFAYAEANAMGKILLNKRVPMIVISAGTITTSENVKEAYAKDWGGRTIPWR
jgi:ABC-type sugar transport system substrate-binding protein